VLVDVSDDVEELIITDVALIVSERREYLNGRCG